MAALIISGGALIRPRHALALAALLAVSACASAPVPTAALDRARTAVRAAEADPAVDRYARPELDSAQDAFAEADRGARRGTDVQTIERWASLAEQRAAAARETARQRSAEAEASAERAARTARVEMEPVAPPASGSADSGTTTGRAALILNDDQFVGDGFTLKPDAEASIDSVARLLQEDPTRVARIDGHSDDTNNRSRSIEFSGRRAEAVRGELVRRGIDARRIAVRALGDSFPVASNDTAIGRQRNRRVDVFVLPQRQ